MADSVNKSPKTASSRKKTKTETASKQDPSSGPVSEPSSDEKVKVSMTSDESTADYEVVTPPPTVDARRGGGLLVITLFVAVCGLGIYATWPLWSPYVAPRFPALEYKQAIDPRVEGIAGRLEALEAKTSGGVVRSATISDMEQERARLQQEVGSLLQRLEKIETTIDGVKEMVVATGVNAPGRETKRAIEAITARLAELEKTEDNFGALGARVEQLETKTDQVPDVAAKQVTEAKSQINSMINKLEDRLNSLEQSESTQQTSQTSVSAIILAVSQLRKSATSGQPFEAEIDSLKALSKNHTEMQAALLVLEQNAKTGTATIGQLRNQFAALAGEIVRADNINAGNSWFESAKKRVMSLVSIRKLGSTPETVTVDSIVVLAEDHLRNGDIAAAVNIVDELKSVSNAASQVAEPWLVVAKSRLKTERAVASLHVYAVSLLASAKG